MESPVIAEEQSNAKTEEEGTTVFHKKRSRRVSFAENTSVHIFDRDEEYNTPPDVEPPSSPYEELGFSERDGDPKQFFRNEEEDDEDDDMDELGPTSPFLRVVRSPSSGGSTIGSVTSNDEDNFFGPVSTSFIRRDFSDSAASDENHDHTMDSTAFSMHFHSIARSDSEGDLKTSTGVHLSFDEKTPTLNSIPSNTRSSMLLTLDKKPDSQPDVSTSKLSTGSQSNDMSLVGEYHAKYDYGRLSPPLDALLADGHNDSHVNANHNHNAFGVSSNASETQASKPLSTNQSIGVTLTAKTKDSVKDAFGINSSLELLATSQGIPSNPKNMAYQLDDILEKENKSPFVGSITRLTDRPSHMLSNGVSLSKSPGMVTPSHNRASLFPRTESLKHGGSISSLQRSISKLRILETSPFSAVLNAKLEDSNSRSLVSLFKMTPLGTFNCSPQNLKEATTAEFRGSQLNESVRFGLGNVGRLGESITTTQLSTTASDGMDYLYIERREDSTPLNVASFNIKEMQHERKGFSYDALCNSDLRGSLTTLSNDIEHENFRTISRESDIPMGLMKASLLSNGRKDGQPSCVNQLSTGDVSSAERKRKTEDVMAEKIARIKRNSNSDVELPSDSGISSIGPNLKDLAEIHSRFFKETKLLSHSVDNMNFHAIDRLVDILGQLQRSKTYQLLSNDIQSQIILDQGSNIQDKRVAETKYLLCKTVHEQAKLQLMHLKQERLLKSVQSLASGIQVSEGLKLNYSAPNSLDVRVMHQQPSSDNIEDIQECKVDCDKMTSMRQAIEDIHKRISNLTNSFHKSYKMKGEPNPADTIAFVNDHLMKRARCQIIRKDLQLWVLDDLKSSKDHHDIVLNFLDLMTQRLTVTAGVIPSTSISNILNETNINKNFKDMDASTAFGYVFDSGLTQRHVGATSLAQETQMTSSLLGNLVDVMEEIQLARIELKNLIHARFHTSLDECLHLELHFFDPNGRKKATVTLNTSCLKRGIYPSEIVPCQIFSESQNSSFQSLSIEIAAAIQDLGVGFLRILRLCRCISQLVSSSR